MISKINQVLALYHEGMIDIEDVIDYEVEFMGGYYDNPKYISWREIDKKKKIERKLDEKGMIVKLNRLIR